MKTNVISIRLSDEEKERLLELVKESQCETMSQYFRYLLKEEVRIQQEMKKEN